MSSPDTASTGHNEQRGHCDARDTKCTPQGLYERCQRTWREHFSELASTAQCPRARSRTCPAHR
eukprot:7804581-Alexandrium_andersonii.AAC.1